MRFELFVFKIRLSRCANDENFGQSLTLFRKHRPAYVLVPHEPSNFATNEYKKYLNFINLKERNLRNELL